jgi:hypothetical protein
VVEEIESFGPVRCTGRRVAEVLDDVEDQGADVGVVLGNQYLDAQPVDAAAVPSSIPR